jgi:hypothetical protein
MTRQVSYWLVPSEEDRAWFQELIDTLAHTHEAPRFVPHVTIYSAVISNDQSLTPDLILFLGEGTLLLPNNLRHVEQEAHHDGRPD